MANTDFKTIDEYISTFPKDIRDILKKTRKVINEAAPGAEEVISYQLPTFKLNGKYLIYLGGWKDHISLYPTNTQLEESIKGVAEYKTGKGTLQFPFDKPIPFDIITKIVKFKVKEIEEIVTKSKKNVQKY